VRWRRGCVCYDDVLLYTISYYNNKNGNRILAARRRLASTTTPRSINNNNIITYLHADRYLLRIYHRANRKRFPANYNDIYYLYVVRFTGFWVRFSAFRRDVRVVILAIDDYTLGTRPRYDVEISYILIKHFNGAFINR